MQKWNDEFESAEELNHNTNQHGSNLRIIKSAT